MSRKPNKAPSPDKDPEQSKRFIEAAREAQADESEEGASKAFKKVVPTRLVRPSPKPKAGRDA